MRVSLRNPPTGPATSDTAASADPQRPDVLQGATTQRRRDSTLWLQAALNGGLAGDLPDGQQFVRGSVIWSEGFTVVLPLEPGGGPKLKLVHAADVEAAVKAVEGQEVELHGRVEKDTFRLERVAALHAAPLPLQPLGWPTRLAGDLEGCAVDAQFYYDPGMPGVPGGGAFGLGSLRLLVPVAPQDIVLQAAVILDADGHVRRVSRYLTTEVNQGEIRFYSASLGEACKRVRLGNQLRVGVVFDYQGTTRTLLSPVVGVENF